MATAFQSGAFQSGAFQLDAAPVAERRNGGDGSLSSDRRKQARRARYVRNRHYVIRPEPIPAKPDEVPVRVTKADVREAIAQLPGWFGTLADARQAVPVTIPMPIMDMQGIDDRRQMIAAVRAYLEMAAQAHEAFQREEEDIELLLLAAA